MEADQPPLIDAVCKLIDYDPETGALTWKRRGIEWFSDCKRPDVIMKSWNAKHCGKPALNVDNQGYRQGWFLGRKTLKAHHAAWAIYHGEWPDRAIDHINGVRDDNRIANLRLASVAQNCANRSYSHAGYHGVQKRKNGEWMARIKKGGVSRYLGQFKTEVEAAKAYDQAARDLHGEFARPNFPMG